MSVVETQLNETSALTIFNIMKAKGSTIKYVLDLQKLLNSEETHVIQGSLTHGAKDDENSLLVYRHDTNELDRVLKHEIDGDVIWYKDFTLYKDNL